MNGQPQMGKFRRWLDERSGMVGFWRRLLALPYRGGAGWRHVFGTALLLTAIVQMVTGILLLFHYVPHPDHALDSVGYIQNELIYGDVIRGLHHWGASLIVVLLGLHFLQVILFGAYKKPRELNWWTGLLMMAVVLTLAFTGYTLPWDQKGYWGANIAISMVGGVPLIGPSLSTIATGGPAMGINTLTQLFALHTAVFPTLLMIIFIVHAMAFFKQGPTPGWWVPDDNSRSVPYSPYQLFRDALAFFFVFALILALSVLVPAALGNRADPTAAAAGAKPEWFFLWIFYGMRFAQGGMALVVELLVPAVLALYFILMPVLDRGAGTDPKKRWGFLVVPGLVVLLAAALTTLALLEPAEGQAPEPPAEPASRAEGPAPPAQPPQPEISQEELSWARETFVQDCTGCHGADGKGAHEGTPYFSREFFARKEDEKFIETIINGKDHMPPFGEKFLPDRIRTLLAFLKSEFGERSIGEEATPEQGPGEDDIAWGGETFSENCARCHGADGKGIIDGMPYFSREFFAGKEHEKLVETIASGSSPMPAFGETFSREEIEKLLAFLIAEFGNR